MNRNKTIRLTESNLHKIIKESVKQILRENNILNEAYGIDIDDTLAWVQKKRPDLSIPIHRHPRQTADHLRPGSADPAG